MAKDSHVVLVAATGLPDAIDPSMRRPGKQFQQFTFLTALTQAYWSYKAFNG
jgi:SpoVK/Ycf46/Vps4 family AAA+-type ATPase